MHIYMSGTPKLDPYMVVENRLNTHRLFSMHAEYERPVIRWVNDIKNGIVTAKDFLKAYPQHIDLMKTRDIKRRQMQSEYGITADWDLAELLQTTCESLEGKPHPHTILLDSGAFTAWNKGEVTTVDEVKRKYARFIEEAGDLFDAIWMINLDVIPGERGRSPTEREVKEAVRVSDINFEILTKEFGERILPVFHQGEDNDRLIEVVNQVKGKSNYLCVSPRNDIAETLRVKWSRDVHKLIRDQDPNIMTHGLATTGNKMVRDVPWYSGDSAAWVHHAGFGLVDIFHDENHAFGKKHEPHYMNYFVSMEGVKLDETSSFLLADGTRTTVADLGFDDLSSADLFKRLMPMVASPDDLPFVGGHIRDHGKHYSTLPQEHQDFIRDRIERLSIPFEVVRWDFRMRTLVCMAEFVNFAEWANDAPKAFAQMELF